MVVDPILLGLFIIVIISAILTIESKELMHAAFFLGLLLVTLGEVYILFGAEYIGVIQILVYAGGVTVIMLFALMFIPRKEAIERGETIYRALGTVLALGIISLILLGIGLETKASTAGSTIPYRDLANSLLSGYGIGVLVIILVLFSTIVAASYISGERREKYG